MRGLQLCRVTFIRCNQVPVFCQKISLRDLFQAWPSKVLVYDNHPTRSYSAIASIASLSIVLDPTSEDYCRAIGSRASGKKEPELAVLRQGTIWGTKAGENFELTEGGGLENSFRENNEHWLFLFFFFTLRNLGLIPELVCKFQLREDRKAKAAKSKEAGKILLWHFVRSQEKWTCAALNG